MAGFGNMDFRGERKSERKLEKESEVNERQEDFHMENRYELNKQLAQMLKGGVIMDVTTPDVQSWHWKESRQISVQQAEFPE